MRAFLVLVLILTACTTQPNAATSPTPTPTASATASPSPTASPARSPSPSSIALPSIAQLSAPSGTAVWALVGGTRLFRSTTRGDAWEERALPVPSPQSFAFVSERDGFLLIAGDAGALCGSVNAEIWHTSDGAATWDKLPATGISDPCKSDVSMASTSQAFVVGLDRDKAAVVYRTQDGGLTWQISKPLPTAPALSTTAGLYPHRVRAFGTTLLMEATAGSPAIHFVFRSTDGGATWSYTSTAPPATEGLIAFVSPSRWIAIGAPGASQETRDSGASWHAYTTDYAQAGPVAPTVVFGDTTVGYATVRGTIQRTTDGGAHWTTIKTPGT